MLQSRNLDDQSFDEIVEYAVSRLPWLCPEWTNHNASDPGITIIELMAWYKEMQQYHMNSFTDDMKRRLLKLVGVEPQAASAARCGVEPTDGGRGYAPLSRLETPEGIVFELEEAIPADRAKMLACFTDCAGELTDISDALSREGLGIAPFRQIGDRRSELLLGFDRVPEAGLRLWIDVDASDGPERTPFLTVEQCPRDIVWSFSGSGEVSVLHDDTHALSRSGYISFAKPEGLEKTEVLPGTGSAVWLRARLTDPGCEETVRITGVSTDRFPAVQRETWAKTELREVQRRKFCRVLFDDELSREAVFTAFMRTDDGWTQLTQAEAVTDDDGVGIRFDSRNAAKDGGANLAVVCTDPIHYSDMYFDSDGLPGMTLQLALGGRQALRKSFTLICDSLEEDGGVRPEVWRCVDDFYGCGPRDRVFTYDEQSETITFGDGRQGAVVPAGAGAVLISRLELSRCDGGNIPAGDSLRFYDGGAAARNTIAVGGANTEPVNAAAERFLRELGSSVKCVNAADYEATAKRTPGLRVATAKAIPGYDPAEPSGRSDRPVVTVVVIPYSQSPRPEPDARFLDAVRRHMDLHRPICSVVRVVAPRYVGVGVSLQIKAQPGVTERALRELLEGCLELRPGGRAIGDKLVCADLAMQVQRLPGVLKVSRLELRPLGPDCYVTTSGDIVIPRNAVAFLQDADIRVV